MTANTSVVCSSEPWKPQSPTCFDVAMTRASEPLSRKRMANSTAPLSEVGGGVSRSDDDVTLKRILADVLLIVVRTVADPSLFRTSLLRSPSSIAPVDATPLQPA